jgi:DNA gyrase subunit A
VKSYRKILEDRATMTNLIISDLERIKSEYSRPRRTAIENTEQAVVEAAKIEEHPLIMLMDKFGYTKTIDVAVYEKNRDAVLSESQRAIDCINTSKICIFTNKGQMHQVNVMDIPHGRLRDKGTPIDNISNYVSSDEQIVFVCDEMELKEKMLLFVTQNGMMKQVRGEEFIVSKRTVAATKLIDDEVVSICFVTNKQNVVLSTHGSVLLKFASSEVPEKKRGAVGVRGIKLSKNDFVDALYLYEDGVETKITYKDKPLVLNRLKMSKRDSVGTKQK